MDNVKSRYSHKNKLKNGIYNMNCTGFIKLILSEQNITCPIQEVITSIPTAFRLSVANNTPSPIHYMFFFKSQTNKKYWSLISNAFLLIPGDFIVYDNIFDNTQRTKKEATEKGQHIMIVADQPYTYEKNPNLLFVPIFDSTKQPHGTSDQRIKGTGGFGRGTIGLMLDKDDQPTKLAWSAEQAPNKKWLARDIKMARIRMPLH